MKQKKYDFRGIPCSVSALVRLSNGLSRNCIENRLENGWPVEAAITTPANVPLFPLDENYRNKVLDVTFTKKIPGVFASMQPEIGTTYTAVPHGMDENPKKKSKLYYIIELEQYKPLIVYPGEFQVLGIAGV